MYVWQIGRIAKVDITVHDIPPHRPAQADADAAVCSTSGTHKFRNIRVKSEGLFLASYVMYISPLFAPIAVITLTYHQVCFVFHFLQSQSTNMALPSDSFQLDKGTIELSCDSNIPDIGPPVSNKLANSNVAAMSLDLSPLKTRSPLS